MQGPQAVSRLDKQLLKVVQIKAYSPFNGSVPFPLKARRIPKYLLERSKDLKVRYKIVCQSRCLPSASQKASPSVLPLYVFSFYSIVFDPLVHQFISGRGRAMGHFDLVVATVIEFPVLAFITMESLLWYCREVYRKLHKLLYTCKTSMSVRRRAVTAITYCYLGKLAPLCSPGLLKP